MKVLLVTKDKSKFEKVENCIKSKFVDLQLSIAASASECFDYITSEGPIAFFMMDMEFDENITELLNDMIDLAGERPIVICGNDEQLDGVNKSLIIKNEGNTVLRDLEDEEKVYLILSSALKWSEENHFEEAAVSEKEEDQYIGIKLGNLYLYDSFPHNLYIKIGENKYILALEQNTPIYHSHIGKLIQRRIKTVYIEKDKHIKFLENSIIKATSFFEENTELNKKTVMAHLRSAALIQDYLINIGVSTTISSFIDTYLKHMILALDSMFKFELAAKHYSFKFESIISKALISAYLNYYILKELGWKSDTVRKKFLLASIIQDSFLESDAIAKLKNFADPLITNFTEEEINNFPNHPAQIAEIARQLTEFPDIDFLLEQHHELPGRDGFPNRPPASELQVAVCAFNLGSNFARDIDGMEFSSENFQKIIRLYDKEFNVGNFKEPFKALKKALLTEKL